MTITIIRRAVSPTLDTAAAPAVAPTLDAVAITAKPQLVVATITPVPPAIAPMPSPVVVPVPFPISTPVERGLAPTTVAGAVPAKSVVVPLRAVAPAAARPAVHRGIATLADLVGSLTAAGTDEAFLRDLRWAVNALCGALGVASIDIAADAQDIRAQMGRLSPAMMGIEPAAFGNIRTYLRRAMRLAGKTMRRRARNVPLAPEWAPLYDRLPTKAAKAGVGSFLTMACEQGWRPDDVGDGHVVRFLHILAADSLCDDRRPAALALVKEWNKAVGTVEGWPATRLSVPGGAVETFSVAWLDLPPGFLADAEAYLAYLADPPVDDDEAPLLPLRARTIEGRRFDLRQIASVLLRGGMPPDSLTCLKDLLAPAAIDAILAHFEPGKDGAGRSRRVSIAIALKVVDRYWARTGEATQQRLAKDIKRHTLKNSSGMVRKNRAKVAQFKDPAVAARFLLLPPRLFAALDKIESPTRRDANLALAALYMELTQMWPARVGNMSAVHLQRNIIRTGKGATARVHLRFDAAEVKTDVDLEAELPPTAVRLLDLFIQRYRPLLVDQPSLYLFPAGKGGPRSPRTLWATITTVTRRYVGVAINPHLFRHLMGYFHLMARPGDYETMRRVWGHASLATGQRNYLGLETDGALKTFDDNVLRLREDARARLATGQRRGSRKPPRHAD